jgi:mono/diheme cytochrome c family protein
MRLVDLSKISILASQTTKFHNMRKLVRIVGILLGVVVLAAAGGFIYMKTAFPKVGPVSADVKVQTQDTAILARGEYLVHHVAGCVDCHTPRQMDIFAIPRIPGKDGMGGMAFTRDLGFPGDFYSKNITSDKKTGIGDWSDAQLFHTVTTGVRKNGDPLFPLMPYLHYGKADQKDMEAILAYIRTLKPIENQVAESAPDFPVNLFMRMKPCDANCTPAPDRSNNIAYGQYLVNLASCEDCHTPRDDKGEFVPGQFLAGGSAFNLKGMGTVTSGNLTPDNTTGIGSWTKEMFIQKFKAFDGNDSWKVPWQQKGYQTIMPWPEYAGMTEDDLGAIYDYLRTVPAVNKQVTKWKAENEATALK